MLAEPHESQKVPAIVSVYINPLNRKYVEPLCLLPFIIKAVEPKYLEPSQETKDKDNWVIEFGKLMCILRAFVSLPLQSGKSAVHERPWWVHTRRVRGSQSIRKAEAGGEEDEGGTAEGEETAEMRGPSCDRSLAIGRTTGD